MIINKINIYIYIIQRVPFRFRKGLKRLIANKTFDYSILFFIALNCITLAMERPSIPPISAVCQFVLLLINKEKLSEIFFSSRNDNF